MSLQADGTNAVLAYIEEETTWATVPASSKVWTGFRFNNETLGKDINNFESEEIRSDRMTSAILRGNRNPNGDVTFELGPNSHNLLLRHLLGADWSTAGTVAPYTHTTQGHSSLPQGGLTFVKGYTDVPSYLVYPGGRVDTVSLEIPQEGIVSGSASLLFQSEVDPSATVPYSTPLSYPTGDPYESNLTQISVQAYDASGSYVWTANEIIGVATAGRFTVSNGLDPSSYVLNSVTRYDIPAGRRRVEGNVNLLFEDTTEYLRYVNGTALAMRIKMISGSYSHTWDFPNVRYAGSKPTPAVGGEGGIRQDMPFRAIRHETLGYDIALEVVSDETIVRY